MKGLLLDNIYKTVSNMKILLLVLLISGGIIVTLVDNQFVIQAFIGSIFFSISVGALIGIRKDIASGWCRYEVSLPIKKDKIVVSKFLSYLFWMAISVVLALAFTLVVINMKGYEYFDFGIRDIITLFFVCISFSLVICAFFYGNLYLIGLDNADVLIIVSILLSTVYLFILIYLLNVTNISIETGRIVILGVSSVMFVLSMHISMKIYNMKEI